ncbi:Calx-beta domain-containing protein [Roseivivax sediminis]|uniref:Hemolysin-type calcium-binding repeat-containing protein n=1 Tax=Roseivivax sediminis TaxID=936889 RepID=A0A1I2EE14_9RHOB|nr:Calx-beta domain-containing protein [Roseivivax sediminis]SFE91182.1 Hemolysin-type calcium-binding repeat-containing protein [Roseivivax sediminis]
MPSFISVATSPADESIGSGFGGSLEWRVELSEAASDTVFIPYRLFPGTAQIDVDIPTSQGTLTFSPGTLTQTLSISARSDSVIETDESVVVEFYDPVGAEFFGDNQTLRVTNFILDDDGSDTDRAMLVSSPVIVEGDGGTREAVFTVSISEAFSSVETFAYSTRNGTASAGSDYTAKSGNVRFVPGQTEAEIRIDISGDNAVEPSEYFHLVVETDARIADGGIGATGRATILDDDAGGAGPTVSLAATGAVESIGSGFGGIATFVVRLSEASDDAVTVGYRTFQGTAQKHIDYPPQADRLTFAPGETWKVVTVRVDSDGIFEPDESFGLELFDVSGGALAGDAPLLRETAFILDDDGTGIDRGLHVSSPVLVEGDSGSQRALFDITISEPSATALSFDYATQGAGARAGSDFTQTSGTVTFAPGQTRATVAVAVSGDTAREPTEFVQLAVTPTGALGDGGAGAVGLATILDDDGGALPVLSTSPAVVRESIGSGFGGTLSLVVTLSEPSSDAVTVSYRTLGATATSHIDFPRGGDTLTFAPGETSKTVNLRVLSDNAFEDDEALFFEFFDIAGATFAGGAKVLRETAFILDDDDPGLSRSLQVSEPVLLEGDAGTSIARFELTLSRPVEASTSFDWATADSSAEAGSDYTAASGTVTFAPGQTRAFVDVRVSGDTASEATEFFQLSVTPTSALGDGGAGATGRAFLIDDDGEDGLPTISIASTDTRESIGSGFGGTIDFVVTLSEPAEDTVTVQYRSVDRTTSAGTDYAAFEGTVTFAPGETSKTISPRVTSDNVDEDDESFSVELFSPTGAVLAGGVPVLTEAAFIIDDDGVGLDRALHVSDVFITEPVSGTATATFEIRLSRAFDTATTLDYETVAGSASAGSDYTPASGSITFLPGQIEAAVNVTVRSDNDFTESPETFLLSIPALPSTVAGGAAGSLGTATIRQPPVPRPPEGEVVINGIRRSGETLELDLSDLSDPNGLGAFSYQWQRNGVAIADATAASYTLVPGDVGSSVSVVVSYTDGLGTEEAVSASAGTIDVAAPTAGDDSIVGGPLDDRVEGGDGNDTLEGADGDDGVLGQAGNDNLFGGPGDDNIAGSDGNDLVVGGPGDDFLGGGEGSDTMLGQAGNDTLGGGFGDDEIDGGAGDDVAAGGPGDDRMVGGDGGDTMGGSFGADTVLGEGGADSLGGGTGTDSLSGGAGADSIGGGEGNDTVEGGGGNDFLAGGGRDDVVDGGAGDDTINGGEGSDTLTGGAGADVFIFRDFVAGDADVITDFVDGVDRITIVGQGGFRALTIDDGAAGAVVTTGGTTITFSGLEAADLGPEDFAFL